MNFKYILLAVTISNFSFSGPLDWMKEKFIKKQVFFSSEDLKKFSDFEKEEALEKSGEFFEQRERDLTALFFDFPWRKAVREKTSEEKELFSDVKNLPSHKEYQQIHETMYNLASVEVRILWRKFRTTDAHFTGVDHFDKRPEFAKLASEKNRPLVESLAQRFGRDSLDYKLAEFLNKPENLKEVSLHATFVQRLQRRDELLSKMRRKDN